MVFLIVHSPSAIRHAFYETFLVLHICAAVVALVGIYVHLTVKYYWWARYIEVAVAIWSFDRTARLLRILYRNVGRKMTTATIEVLPGEAVRVTLVSFDFNVGRSSYH